MKNFGHSFLIVFLFSVFSVSLFGFGATGPARAGALPSQADTQPPESSKKTRPHTAKTRKKNIKKESAGHNRSGMKIGREKPAAQPSEPAMPGMEMGKPGTQSQMATMDHGGMNMGQPHSFIEAIVSHGSSGTSAEPNSTPHAMIMTKRGDWMLMLHGVGFLNSNQQSGPRGRDKIFSTNWIMPMAQRKIGPGTLTLRTMLSLEPATVTKREYPELFQVGETAYGKAIVDGQHPHDFFMELAALYDVKVGAHGLLSFYAAPVGDPAMGPTGFPHRMSASENPLAALGHHLEDSTHIADDVLTAGFAYKVARLEFSGFHGREPDEYRWDLDSGRIDSWSTRLTVSPAQNWSGQYSIGRLKSPEQLNPNEDFLRMTASVMYNRPITNGNWASTLVWGRNRTLPEGEVINGYLAESTLNFRTRNYFWGRLENVDRTNELLLGQNIAPPGFQEHFLARVQAYTMGYDREFNVIPHVAAALGGQITFYGIPGSLVPTYGSHPSGIVLFLRVRPVGNH